MSFMFRLHATFPIRPCFSYFWSLPRSHKMRSSVWSSNSRLASEARHALLLGWDDWLYRLSCAYQPHCQRWDDETKNVTCKPTYRCRCTDSSRLSMIKITIEMKRIELWVSSTELILHTKQFYRTFMRTLSLLSLPLLETNSKATRESYRLNNIDIRKKKCFFVKRSHEFEKKLND